jgi:hypothetical protein
MARRCARPGYACAAAIEPRGGAQASRLQGVGSGPHRARGFAIRRHNRARQHYLAASRPASPRRHGAHDGTKPQWPRCPADCRILDERRRDSDEAPRLTTQTDERAVDGARLAPALRVVLVAGGVAGTAGRDQAVLDVIAQGVGAVGGEVAVGVGRGGDIAGGGVGGAGGAQGAAAGRLADLQQAAQGMPSLRGQILTGTHGRLRRRLLCRSSREGHLIASRRQHGFERTRRSGPQRHDCAMSSKDGIGRYQPGLTNADMPPA